MMTQCYTAKNWPFLAAGASFLILCGAWFFQYVLGYAPCALCFDQRHIHWAVIGTGLAAGLAMHFVPALRRFAPIACLLIAAIFVYSAGFAGWHAGIEYGWWEGPGSCTTAGSPDVSLADINALLHGTGAPVVMCDEAAWTLLGISMAGYNAYLSALLAAASVVAATRRGHV